jgi:hypothetical protein
LLFAAEDAEEFDAAEVGSEREDIEDAEAAGDAALDAVRAFP